MMRLGTRNLFLQKVCTANAFDFAVPVTVPPLSRLMPLNGVSMAHNAHSPICTGTLLLLIIEAIWYLLETSLGPMGQLLL